MAGFTCLACGAHACCHDGIFVSIEGGGNEGFDIARFAENLIANKFPSYMAFHASNLSMRRYLVCSIFRRHGMAGGAAEGGRGGVLPTVCSPDENGNCEDA